ncbi:MAG: Lrp/AsnC family transcriptional regulator [Oscillospiraceae bacterium]|nr:Lrp/AsnC family transcriptional regulator [Oscillospiraceae bacterium]MBQ8978914.1 Lrp/AsnC family transcriptional regulator [Oscillospiraceae bacterium]
MDQLLTLLKENARLSVSELAAMAAMSEEDVKSKIAAYEKDGTIRGYQALINEELADKNAVTAFIEVKVTPKAERGFDELANTIMGFDGVESVYLMSGSFDLAVTLSGTDYKEIALFVARRLSTLDGVVSTSTHFLLKKYKDRGVYMDTEIDERGLIAP